jgi:hypothetical protein
VIIERGQERQETMSDSNNIRDDKTRCPLAVPSL